MSSVLWTQFGHGNKIKQPPHISAQMPIVSWMTIPSVLSTLSAVMCCSECSRSQGNVSMESLELSAAGADCSTAVSGLQCVMYQLLALHTLQSPHPAHYWSRLAWSHPQPLHSEKIFCTRWKIMLGVKISNFVEILGLYVQLFRVCNAVWCMLLWAWVMASSLKKGSFYPG